MSTATPLIAVLLITTSSSGTSLVFRHPPYPRSSTRLIRPLPYRQGPRHGLDGIYQASHLPDTIDDLREQEEAVRDMEETGAWADDTDDYLWHRPSWGSPPGTPTSVSGGSGGSGGSTGSARGRSTSRPPSSKNTSPSAKERQAELDLSDGLAYDEQAGIRADYDRVLDFDAPTLAEILAPARELCYQKFELVVDDLAFVGHPVCVARDGVWRMDNLSAPPARGASPERERGRSLPPSSTPAPARSGSPDVAQARTQTPSTPAPERITFFHLVLVIDRPDPASYHTSDLSAFLAPYHAQIAFKLTAGLLHEEARAAYVSAAVGALLNLQEQALGRGLWYEEFSLDATAQGGNALARLMRDVYEAVHLDATCKVAINHIVVDVQLPPRALREDWGEQLELEDELLWEDGEGFGPDVAVDRAVYGWVPKLRPWSALLVLDEGGEVAGEDMDTSDEQREAGELRQRFFATVSPTLSLADVSTLLDLDLYADVFPLARALIYTRKAKLVDVVRENLKSIYYPTSDPDVSLPDHFHAFARRFPALPHLAAILSSLSLSPAPFASIVPAPKDRQAYLDALIWLLERGLVQMMHVRVRLVAPRELKEAAYAQHAARANRRKLSMTMTEPTESEDMSTEPSSAPNPNGLLSPMMLHTARLPAIHQSSADEGYESSSSDMLDRASTSEDESDLSPSIIVDPGRATKVERRWLDEMGRGKDHRVVDLFERLLPYFDGKTTMDEILYRTEVGRRELREVLHRFDPYVLTSLHS